MADENGPSVDEFVAEYERCRPLYLDFASECERVLNKLLTEAGLSALIHSVDSRTKGIENLREKIGRPDKEYGQLTEVTDLAGLRVITYFAEDVDKVAAVIDAEFMVDWANSDDRREVEDPERFGYTSLHYVCSFSEDRAKLTDFKRFDGLLLEVQVRSFLQHGWAEIHHDLGYKTEEAIPAILRRRFARLAGLLELADDEFGAIRSELRAYEARVREEIVSTPATVQIDKASLTAFLNLDARTLDLDRRCAATWQRPLEEAVSKGYVEHLVSWLGCARLKTIQHIQTALEADGTVLLPHFQMTFEAGVDAIGLGDISRVPLARGYALYRLGLILLARQGGTAEIVRSFGEARFAIGKMEGFARVVVSAVADLDRS